MYTFYRFGGRHDGAYYGFSTGATGKVKIVGEEYISLPGDKATVIDIKKQLAWIKLQSVNYLNYIGIL